MTTWAREIFTEEVNADFFAEITDLDRDDIIEAIRDAVVLGNSETASNDEFYIGLAAATVVAIWAGAPYSDADVIEEYPFIRELIGTSDESLTELALELLESAETELDLDFYLEALS